MRSVMFVCTANICRSPMAMGLFLKQVESQAKQWRVTSSGIYALPGAPAAQNTLLVLQRRGIDLSSHRSTPVIPALVEASALILTMEFGQKEALRAAFPQHARKVCLLSEMVGEKREIVDPIGGEFIDFEETALEIEDILRRGFERIYNLAIIVGDHATG